MSDPFKPAPWAVRRRIVALTLIYIAGNVEWLIIRGADTALNREIATGLIYAGVGIIGTYVFGAVWDAHSRRKTNADE